MAYHLSGLEEVRALIADKGGPACVPAEGDTVNMLDILHEITVGVSRGQDMGGGGGQGQSMFSMQLMGDDDDDEEDEEEDEVLRLMQLMSSEMNEQFDGMNEAERNLRLDDQVKPGGQYTDDYDDDDAAETKVRVCVCVRMCVRVRVSVSVFLPPLFFLSEY